MKSILIIAKNQNTPSVELLRHLAGKIGCKAILSDAPGHGDLVINRNFGMDYRDEDLELIAKLKLNTLNPVEAQYICRDKWRAHQWLLEHGFDSPQTVMAADFCSIEGDWVLKTQRGMQGRGISYWDAISLREHLGKLEDTRYVVQEKVDFDREIRSFHLGERIIWYEKSGGNLFQGGTGQRIHGVDPRIENLAKRIAKTLGLRLGAIDFLLKGDKTWPVDLNCYPGFKLLGDDLSELEELLQRCVKLSQ